MASFRDYLPDFLLLLAGVFVGTVGTVAVIALLGGDLPRFLALTRVIPPVGPPVLYTALVHLLAALLLTVMPAVGVLGVLYLDYRTIR